MTPSVRIKVCGVTSVADARAVALSGADSIGLMFYEKSPRHVTIRQAAEIVRSLPPFISVVGLFVDADDVDIENVLSNVPLTLLQFHGNETESQCSRWGHRYIKAFRVKPDVSVSEMVAPYFSASGYLLDSYRKGVPGGTGEKFDWQLVPDNLDKPVILAGGLEPGNVAEAIRQVRPYAVDVSSGVESSPGFKDQKKVNAFIKATGR